MLCGFVSIDVSMLLFLGFMVLDLWFGEVWDQILDESSEIVTNFFFLGRVFGWLVCRIWYDF